MTSTTTETTEPIAEYPISNGTNIPFMVESAMLESLRPKPPRPDQIDWSRFRNQRKIRKNKRRLFAAGGRVDFKK